MATTLELEVRGSTDLERQFLTWTPIQALLRIVDQPAPGQAVEAVLRTKLGVGGRLQFRVSRTDEPSDEMTLALPENGEPEPFFLSGAFGFPSQRDGDAVLEVLVEGDVLLSAPFTVRIRKNAESLTDEERDDFLSALAILNDRGTGVFGSFRAMHTEASQLQAHGQDGFFPWHRAYLLDLERELQKIVPTVSLPYWQFDDPAPRLFSEDFLGRSDRGSFARLSPANPLVTWTTEQGQVGILRTALFDPRTSGAFVQFLERSVVASTAGYNRFRRVVEGDPHGSAHTSFRGDISDVPTAAKDPLFFLLHCNVDRLWAKWQWANNRFDPARAQSYFFQGTAGDPGSAPAGHNRLDSMWPWNNITNQQGRPPTAPRQPFPASPTAAGPPQVPEVGDVVDLQGRHSGPPLGYDYDDVPFDPRS
jgi:tyrosinase